MSKELFHNPAPESLPALYLDLIKRCLLNSIYAENEVAILSGFELDAEARLEGKAWPSMAHTMIGQRRLENLQYCVETVLKDGIAGDLLEAGVWRGGATIFMRAILKAHQVVNRVVWVVDSFAGVPAPNPQKYPLDAGMFLHKFRDLAVPLDQVKANFVRYGLLDDQVRFLKGWFKDTLPAAPIRQLAVLRLDGDLYESTMDVLTHLYPKVTAGGFVIVDDYGEIASCRQAVTDYRSAHDINNPIMPIDWTGVYWRR
ncbi:MAG TPA: TylF/MycF family methyltransferase [Pyrinomonadaceae bacterium]|nr:TylF/MycF family methyltransferase [Pyrinomonadaceae bacterium]